MAGRPTTGKKQVSIRLQEETIQILQEASALENKSPSDLVEELIKCTFPKEARRRYRMGFWECEEEYYLHKKYIVIPSYRWGLKERRIELHYNDKTGKWYYEDRVTNHNDELLKVHVFLDFASGSRIVCNEKNENIEFNIENYELERFQQLNLLKTLQKNRGELRIKDIRLYFNKMRDFIQTKGLVNEFNTYYCNEEDNESFKDMWWKE